MKRIYLDNSFLNRPFDNQEIIQKMKKTKIKEKSLIKEAFDVLFKKLGPEKTVRFWNLALGRKIDYLKLRKRLFSKKSLKQIYKEALKFNK